MAKTQFSNGNILTPAWVNSVYGTGVGGGHVHDAVDADGHCSQVDLGSHVTGVMPISRTPQHTYSTVGCEPYSTDYSTYYAGVGKTVSFDNYLITNTTPLQKVVVVGGVKQSWTAGAGGGAVPSTVNLTNGTWYHIFLIAKPDVGSMFCSTVDSGVDTSLSASNLMAAVAGLGFTKYRRIGSLLYEGSVVTRFNYAGDMCGITGLSTQLFYPTNSNDITVTLPVPPVPVIANVLIKASHTTPWAPWNIFTGNNNTLKNFDNYSGTWTVNTDDVDPGADTLRAFDGVYTIPDWLPIQVTGTQANLPSPLIDGHWYYAKAVDATHFQLHFSLGDVSVVDITDTGTASFTVKIGGFAQCMQTLWQRYTANSTLVINVGDYPTCISVNVPSFYDPRST